MIYKNQIAVVGCGYWGINLVRVFNQIGALSIVCDPIEANRQRALEIAPGIQAVSNFADALSSSVRGIIIATPAETHYELAKQALEAGKDVFVEKPLALTYDEGKSLVSLAAERGRILMVGHVLEYHPGIVALRGLIKNGELGDIYYIYSHRLGLGKVRREENILWSFAPHDIAVILRLSGKSPVQVTATGGNYLQPHIADVTVTNLLFADDSRAHIFVSWLNPFKEQRLVVVGSQKMASFDDVGKQLVLYDQHVDIRQGEPIPVRGVGEAIDYPPDEPLLLECIAFMEAIASRQQPITDGPSGLRVLEVLQGAQQSLETKGMPVSLPTQPARS